MNLRIAENIKRLRQESQLTQAQLAERLNITKPALYNYFRSKEDILEAAKKLDAEVYMPPLKLCGDNGAMIGAQGYFEYLAGNVADMSLNAYATKSILGEAL